MPCFFFDSQCKYTEFRGYMTVAKQTVAAHGQQRIDTRFAKEGMPTRDNSRRLRRCIAYFSAESGITEHGGHDKSCISSVSITTWLGLCADGQYDSYCKYNTDSTTL